LRIENWAIELVPKLQFGNALARKAPALRVIGQLNSFPNSSLGTQLLAKLRLCVYGINLRIRSELVPKLRLGNEFGNTQSRSFANKCVPKPELGNEFGTSSEYAKPELCQQVRSQAGAWERVRNEFGNTQSRSFANNCVPKPELGNEFGIVNFQFKWRDQMKKLIQLTVNDKAYEVAVEPNQTLVDLLRYQLNLTGTKKGCEMGDCGSCTVIMDGKPVNSCLVLAMQANGRNITTIEGLENEAGLHPLQKSFVEKGAVQCGFCTSGMILSGKTLLEKNPKPDEDEIRRAISGNLCRCTGYQKIVEAIKSV
jgi:carbon-monoxide dehydrogenase small subunit